MLILAALLLYLVPFIAWLVQAQRIASRLQSLHPDVFEGLGKPHLFRNNTPTNNVALVSFILGKRQHDLGDEVLADFCRIGRLLFFAAIAFFVVGAGAIVFLA